MPAKAQGASARQSRPESTEDENDRVEGVEIGNTAPDFSLVCVDGKEHKLSDYRNRKVMVCFYRHSYCPACAYAVSNLIGQYKKLAWATRLMVITVFRTDVKTLKQGLTDADAPIRRRSNIGANGYPFLALADPDGIAASTFKVDKRERLRLSGFALALVKPSVFKEIYLSGAKGGDTLLPSEFLVDEDGVIVDVMRARKKREFMAMDRISSFLLVGKQHPSVSVANLSVGKSIANLSVGNSWATVDNGTKPPLREHHRFTVG